jgi:triacylglycerol lipase
MAMLVLDVAVVLAALALAGWLGSRLAPEPAARTVIDLQRRAARLRDCRVHIDGFEIAYWDGGTGAPLVLVHGMGASRSTFLAAAHGLARHYRVIIPDLPGFGDSEKPANADYGVDAQVDYLDQFLTAIGIKTAHFGGNSLGGWIAAAYAARFPAKVDSLWLLAAAGTADLWASAATKAYLDHQDYVLLVRRPGDFRRVLELILYRVPPIPYCIVKAMELRAAANFELHRKMFDDLVARATDFQIEPRLPDVRAPALLVWGDHDRIVPPSAMATYHALLPGSQTILLPNVGHVPQIEATRRVVTDYLAFRQRL